MWIQKQSPPSVSVFIDSLVASASQDAGGYAIWGQNNLKLSYLLIELFYIGRTVGRTVGRAGGRTVIWPYQHFWDA